MTGAPINVSVSVTNVYATASKVEADVTAPPHATHVVISENGVQAGAIAAVNDGTTVVDAAGLSAGAHTLQVDAWNGYPLHDGSHIIGSVTFDVDVPEATEPPPLDPTAVDPNAALSVVEPGHPTDEDGWPVTPMGTGSLSSQADIDALDLPDDEKPVIGATPEHMTVADGDGGGAFKEAETPGEAHGLEVEDGDLHAQAHEDNDTADEVADLLDGAEVGGEG